MYPIIAPAAKFIVKSKSGEISEGGIEGLRIGVSITVKINAKASFTTPAISLRLKIGENLTNPNNLAKTMNPAEKPNGSEKPNSLEVENLIKQVQDRMSRFNDTQLDYANKAIKQRNITMLKNCLK